MYVGFLIMLIAIYTNIHATLFWVAWWLFMIAKFILDVFEICTPAHDINEKDDK